MQTPLKRGAYACIGGLVLVIIFMLVIYGRFGVYANIALLFNMVFIVALLSLLQATLTLPGIAGIVLTMGMAVDANVLVFERMREEAAAWQKRCCGGGCRICTSIIGNHRRKCDHIDRGVLAVPFRHRAGEGLCRNAIDRHYYLAFLGLAADAHFDRLLNQAKAAQGFADLTTDGYHAGYS